jgi:hypothetical protein
VIGLTSLEDLIRSKDIEFYSYGRHLDTDVDDFGQYNWDLIHHMTEKAGNRIVVTGPGIYKYIRETRNLYNFVNFITQIWHSGTTGRYKDGISIHVDVDIDALSPHYVQPQSDSIINGLGRKVCDAADWVPEISYFEKTWNFALCNAIGGMVGYPGYEHPTCDKSFRYHIALHAQDYMIGTKQQLHRYKKYARQYLDTVFKLAKRLGKDPDSIFEDAWPLHSLSHAAKEARRVAENVSHFTYEPEEDEKEEILPDEIDPEEETPSDLN